MYECTQLPSPSILLSSRRCTLPLPATPAYLSPPCLQPVSLSLFFLHVLLSTLSPPPPLPFLLLLCPLINLQSHKPSHDPRARHGPRYRQTLSLLQIPSRPSPLTRLYSSIPLVWILLKRKQAFLLLPSSVDTCASATATTGNLLKTTGNAWIQCPPRL